jgi:hypothetical protein
MYPRVRLIAIVTQATVRKCDAGQNPEIPFPDVFLVAGQEKKEDVDDLSRPVGYLFQSALILSMRMQCFANLVNRAALLMWSQLQMLIIVCVVC